MLRTFQAPDPTQQQNTWGLSTYFGNGKGSLSTSLWVSMFHHLPPLWNLKRILFFVKVGWHFAFDPAVLPDLKSFHLKSNHASTPPLNCTLLASLLQSNILVLKLEVGIIEVDCSEGLLNLCHCSLLSLHLPDVLLVSRTPRLSVSEILKTGQGLLQTWSCFLNKACWVQGHQYLVLINWQ